MTQAVDFCAYLGVNAQLFLKLPPKRSLQLFAVPDFAARKLPLKPVGVGTVPLANQNFLPPEKDSCGYQNGFSLAHIQMTFYQTFRGGVRFTGFWRPGLADAAGAGVDGNFQESDCAIYNRDGFTRSTAEPRIESFFNLFRAKLA